MMRRHLKFALSCAIFAALLAVYLLRINQVFEVKDYYRDRWPGTDIQQGFYEMRKDTVDVLFLGSSMCMTEFSPQELYNMYGIRSYNYASEQQPPMLSYYRLLEALKYQSPKAVVLDTYLCFKYDGDSPFNTKREMLRKSANFMRWSDVKRQMTEDIRQYDPSENMEGYFLSNLIYHTRWKELTALDFIPSSALMRKAMKGFAMFNNRTDSMHSFFEEDGSQDELAMAPMARPYLEKIADLCKRQGIQLVLVTPLGVPDGLARHHTVNAFARERGLLHIDFSEKEQYESAGLDRLWDTDDHAHLNLWGAQKVTRAVGRILLEECGIEPVADEQWESTRESYAMMLADAQLARETDIVRYLQGLDLSRHALFVAAKIDVETPLDAEVVAAFERVGLDIADACLNCWSYCAIALPDDVLELTDWQPVETKGMFMDETILYEASSGGKASGRTWGSILFNGTEYSLDGRGVNIVVYDTLLDRMVDSVCYSPYTSLMTR